MTQNSKRIFESYLVACARLGDRTAQEELVHRYNDRFLRHAYRLLQRVDYARSAVQDAWIEILRGLPKLRDDAAFPAWAFRIVTRRCAKQIASLRKSRKVFRELDPESLPDRPVENESLSGVEHRSIHAALAQLTPEHRSTIALFYLEEMSVSEVAVSLDIPAGTVKTRLMHARTKLRAILEGE